ncbi:MAG: hypothetical protein ACI9MC_000828 [Kiritimatiellia bacterium]
MAEGYSPIIVLESPYSDNVLLIEVVFMESPHGQTAQARRVKRVTVVVDPPATVVVLTRLKRSARDRQ